MDIGIFHEPSTVDEAVGVAREVASGGFTTFCIPQIFGVDALTTLAVVAREVPEVGLATGVVPTYPRHPVMLAAQALTVQQVSGGRLTLGIGLSHQIVIEGMLGMSFDKPVRHLREYLAILVPLLRGEAADSEGETLTAKLALQIPDAAPVPVLVAALGSQMLSVAGRQADGTVTWMTGPGTIGAHIVPTISRAASDAGRPVPRVVCALPVCVTDDEAEARAAAAERFVTYGYLPSYKAMLEREGAAGPADVAIVGDAATVRAGVEKVFEQGATQFVAVPYRNRAATLEVLAGLL
jgi:5,10-methylenetetrahydromethanopterin reductase